MIDRSRSDYAVTIAKAVVTMDIVFAIISITGSHIHAFPGNNRSISGSGTACSRACGAARPGRRMKLLLTLDFPPEQGGIEEILFEKAAQVPGKDDRSPVARVGG